MYLHTWSVCKHHSDAHGLVLAVSMIKLCFFFCSGLPLPLMVDNKVTLVRVCVCVCVCVCAWGVHG